MGKELSKFLGADLNFLQVTIVDFVWNREEETAATVNGDYERGGIKYCNHIDFGFLQQRKTRTISAPTLKERIF